MTHVSVQAVCLLFIYECFLSSSFPVVWFCVFLNVVSCSVFLDDCEKQLLPYLCGSCEIITSYTALKKNQQQQKIYCSVFYWLTPLIAEKLGKMNIILSLKH